LGDGLAGAVDGQGRAGQNNAMIKRRGAEANPARTLARSHDWRKTKIRLYLYAGYNAGPLPAPVDTMHPLIRRLYLAALLDGCALLLLVFVAVPLKHLADFPLAVRLLGPAHGVLFIWLSINLAIALNKGVLNARLGLLLFFGALLPFGAFYADHRLKRHCAGTAGCGPAGA
jgi:integral membrane protein